MRNNLRKIVYIFIILLFLLLGILKVYAVTENELIQNKNDIEEQINQANTELAGIRWKNVCDT